LDGRGRHRATEQERPARLKFPWPGETGRWIGAGKASLFRNLGHGDPDVRAAGLAGAAQRVEHYEIAGYGTTRSLARRLGENEIAETLQQR
jgi:Domain of unknown function (DUF892)